MLRVSKIRLLSMGVAVLFGAASATHAAIIEADTGPITGTFPVSSTDLINGLTPVTTGTFGAAADAFASNDPTVLTNGDIGAANPNSESGAGRNTLAVLTGDTVTYTLDTSVNTFGYKITNISTYAGWQDNGRDAQNYTVSYSTVAAPTTFLPIATVSYNPGGSLAPSNDQVTLTENTTGILATGVKSILFSFAATQENGYAGYRELDVIGSAAVPEPASAAVLCVAGLGLLARAAAKSGRRLDATAEHLLNFNDRMPGDALTQERWRHTFARLGFHQFARSGGSQPRG